MAMTFDFESDDLDAMLADSPHSITAGGVTHKCFYDVRGAVEEGASGGAPQVLQSEVATIKTAHYPDISDGAEVTIAEGVQWQRQYRVQRGISDNSTTELLLQRM